jgi:phage tail sheath gpL-like
VIQFLQIDPTRPLPGVYTEFQPSVSFGAATPKRRVLVLSTALTGSTGKTGEVVRTYSASDGAKWGQGGPTDAMVRRIYRRAPSAEVYVLALAEAAAGTAAKVDITFTGTATEAGTIELLVGGRLIRVGVASGAAAATVAASTSTAITKTPDLYMTGTVAAAVATATCKWKGVSGSYVTVEILSIPAGLSAAVAATPGTADPDATAAMAVLQAVSRHFTQIVTDWSGDANLDLIEAELTRRDSAQVGLGSVLYVGVSGTKGEMLTWADSRNHRLVCAVASGKSPNPPWEFAAAYAAERAYVAKVRISSMGAMLDLRPPTASSQWLVDDDRNDLLAAGLSTYKVASDGNLIVERLVTTRTEDASGNPDLRDQNVMDQEINAVVRLTIASVGYQAVIGKSIVADTAPEGGDQVSAVTVRAVLQNAILGGLAEYCFDPKASADSVTVERSTDNPNAFLARYDFARVKEASLVATLVEVS